MNKAKELKTTTALVKSILESNKDARNSDSVLYISVCEKLNRECLSYPFSFVFLNHKELHLPSYDTVSRCRRRIQRAYPELAADSTVEGYREVNEDIYRDYARSVSV